MAQNCLGEVSVVDREDINHRDSRLRSGGYGKRYLGNTRMRSTS